MPLQKNRLRSAKNLTFSLLCILVDRPIRGGGWTPNPPYVRPWNQEQMRLNIGKKIKNSQSQLKIYRF